MFSAFVVKIVIFLIWRIWNRWRPFVRKNRVWVHHWLLLLICRHNQFSIYFTNILKYFLGILHKRYFLWKCEKHSHFSFRPPCYRHPMAEIPKPRIRKCKWPDWDCAQSLKGWPIFQFWCKLLVKVFRENLHILSPFYLYRVEWEVEQISSSYLPGDFFRSRESPNALFKRLPHVKEKEEERNKLNKK